MWHFAISNREPILGGIIVFCALLIASYMGEAWQEALVGAISVAMLLWLAKTSSHAKELKRLHDFNELGD